MTGKISFILSVFLALGAFVGLLLCPEASAGGARTGLILCSGVIIPSLFPFVVLANLFLEMGLPNRIGKFLSPLSKKVGISGAGSVAFILGLLSGYPLGAITVSEMYSKGALKKREAEWLLGFCDNSGPAFIISVAGSAVFHSVAIGFFLYGVHILSALLSGFILRSRRHGFSSEYLPVSTSDFAAAFTSSVKRATGTMVTVCGFVVFFSVLVGLLDANGAFSSLSGFISSHCGAELHFSRSLLTGILELSTGTSSMLGLSANAKNLALCSFLLGWGGICVHAQASAVIREGGLSPARHTFGKLLHGILSALITLITFPLFF